MKSIRCVNGSQVVEYVIIAAVLLGLSLGAITIFGAQIAKVFQGDTSPVMVSSSSMKNLQNDAEAESATNKKVRTDIDGNLVTDSLITKGQTDLTIGSAVGQETTGATGGDAIIGGTYDVEDQTALYDGNSETTGNALLDSALATKKSAIDLMNDALSASSLAKVLEDQASGIASKVNAQQDILTDIGSSYDALVDKSTMVQQYIDLLVTLKTAQSAISLDLATILDNTKKVNLDILDQTNNNLLAGSSLLELSNEQNEALEAYTELLEDYEAGKEIVCVDACVDNLNSFNDMKDLYDEQQASSDWATDCVALGKPCDLVTLDMIDDEEEKYETSKTEINNSGITDEQIEAENQKVEDMVASMKGQTMALEETIEELSDVVNFLEVQANEAEKTAEDLLDSAKDTLKKAFWDDDLFDDCTTVDQLITKANNVINDEDYWYDDVKDYWKAKKALELLADSSAAFITAQDLTAKALLGKNNLDQYKDTLNQITSGVVDIELVTSQVDLAKIEEQNNTIQAIASSDDQIAQAQKELDIVLNAIKLTADTITTQQVYINNLNDKATEAVSVAAAAQAEADALVADAQAAVVSADELIKEIVTFK